MNFGISDPPTEEYNLTLLQQRHLDVTVKGTYGVDSTRNSIFCVPVTGKMWILKIRQWDVFPEIASFELPAGIGPPSHSFSNERFCTMWRRYPRMEFFYRSPRITHQVTIDATTWDRFSLDPLGSEEACPIILWAGQGSRWKSGRLQWDGRVTDVIRASHWDVPWLGVASRCSFGKHPLRWIRSGEVVSLDNASQCDDPLCCPPLKSRVLERLKSISHPIGWNRFGDAISGGRDHLLVYPYPYSKIVRLNLPPSFLSEEMEFVVENSFGEFVAIMRDQTVNRFQII